MGEGRGKEGVRVKELDGQVEAPVLPLRFQVVVDLPVRDGQHDDQDPEQHDADEELVDDPHRHHRRRDRLLSKSPHLNARVHVVLGYLRLALRYQVGNPAVYASGVVHGLDHAGGDGVDVDLRLVHEQPGKTVGVVGKVGDLVIVGVASERLEQHPEEVGEDAVGARALCVPDVVVHVGDPAGEGEHYDKESNEEHENILQHSFH